MQNRRMGLTNVLQLYMQDFFMSRNINAYYLRASKETTLPYICYTLRPISSLDDSNYGKKFNLEVNAFDENSGVVINDILDEIERDILDLNESNNYFSISGALAYSRADLIEDAPIIHKRVTLTLNVFENPCRS